MMFGSNLSGFLAQCSRRGIRLLFLVTLNLITLRGLKRGAEQIDEAFTQRISQ